MGAKDPETAARICTDATDMFKNASMRLREWASNCKLAVKTLPQSERSTSLTAKLLGVNWCTESDVIWMSVGSHHTDEPHTVTKRTVLQQMASVYDPLGLMSPISFLGTILLRDTWCSDLSWDDALNEPLLAKWRVLSDALAQVSLLKIPRHRCHGLTGQVSYQLHVFTDASQLGYATAVYLRASSDGTDEVACDLVFAKSRLSPVKKGTSGKKPISLPRLELLGVLIGTRAAKFVVDQLDLPLTSVTLWTDAKCVLHWLASLKPLSVFVSNCIIEIRKADYITFRHVPGECNPADVASRGSADLFHNSLWWKGPPFLMQNSEDWPDSHPALTPEVLQDVAKEERTSTPLHSASLCVGRVSEVLCEYHPLDVLLKRSSCIRSLLRVTVICLKFVKRLLPTWKPVSNLVSTVVDALSVQQYTSANDLKWAKMLWIGLVQQRCFVELFHAISSNAKHSTVDQLGINLDEIGLLRCWGRLQHSEFNMAAHKPLLLPQKDQFTHLIIRDVHGRLFHAGVARTLWLISDTPRILDSQRKS